MRGVMRFLVTLTACLMLPLAIAGGSVLSGGVVLSLDLIGAESTLETPFLELGSMEGEEWSYLEVSSLVTLRARFEDPFRVIEPGPDGLSTSVLGGLGIKYCEPGWCVAGAARYRVLYRTGGFDHGPDLTFTYSIALDTRGSAPHGKQPPP
jgi:hypothetical protein